MPIEDVDAAELTRRLSSNREPLVVLAWVRGSSAGPGTRNAVEKAVATLGPGVSAVAIEVTGQPAVAGLLGLNAVPAIAFFDTAKTGMLTGSVSSAQIVEAAREAFPRLRASGGDGRPAGKRGPAAHAESPDPTPTGPAADFEPGLLPTPNEMISCLDRCIRGQTRAKRDLTAAIYKHFLSEADRDEHGGRPNPHHILLIGPTGCGKTMMVRTIAEWLGVPVVFTSAAGLVEAGFRGRNPESMIRSLLEKAGGDARRAERGIVFLDEVDKIRRMDVSTRDISGEGVQNALLALLDGTICDSVDGTPIPAVDTSRILFVCAGAFVDLPGIIRRRLGRGRTPIGFTPRRRGDDRPDGSIDDALRHVETADLVEFGMIPEFIGRFASVTTLHELGVADLRAILGDGTDGSVLQHYRRLAGLHGIDLVVDDNAIEAIAMQAAALGTGARGLSRLVGRVMDGLGSAWPDMAESGVTQVIVDRDVVESGAEPRRITGSPFVKRRRDQQLRRRYLGKASTPRFPRRPAHRPLEGMPRSEQLRVIERLKKELAWDQTSGSARVWWESRERVLRSSLEKLAAFAEGLANRHATISEAFSVHVQAGTDDHEAILAYIDFLRAKTRAAFRRSDDDVPF